MRELTYMGDRKVEWRDTPDPALQESTDAIVRPVASTTCDVDKMIIAGRAPVPPPFAIGHECVAEVMDVGDDVTHVKPGDLGVVPWHIACGRCDRCVDGLFADCSTVPYMAMYGASIGGEGVCESAGNHFKPGELPLFQMYLNGVNLRVARDNVRANIPAALELAESGEVDPMRVVSHVLDWETLPEALPEMQTKPVFVRDPVGIPDAFR